jgi:SAM-dependent methyltransferase
MNQDVIWDYFQNEGVNAFRGASPRLEFLVNRLKPGERVLNIGVGSGALEALALRKGIEIWSLDPNERAVESLRKGVGVGARAQVGYSHHIPFPDNHFDVIVMSEVIEHLEPSARHASLIEVRRVLLPGGRLIGTVPARERLEDSEVVCPKCGDRFHRWGHQASFDVASMSAILQHDFVIKTVHERFFNEWDSASWGRRLSGLVKRFLSWRGLGTYGLARNIFFVACKRTEDPK